MSWTAWSASPGAVGWSGRRRRPALPAALGRRRPRLQPHRSGLRMRASGERDAVCLRDVARGHTKRVGGRGRGGLPPPGPTALVCALLASGTRSVFVMSPVGIRSGAGGRRRRGGLPPPRPTPSYARFWRARTRSDFVMSLVDIRSGAGGRGRGGLQPPRSGLRMRASGERDAV